jgi:hypothetical protein
VGVTDAGKVQGRFRATGVSPKVLERLRVSGIQVPHNIFEETVSVNLSGGFQHAPFGFLLPDLGGRGPGVRAATR